MTEAWVKVVPEEERLGGKETRSGLSRYLYLQYRPSVCRQVGGLPSLQRQSSLLHSQHHPGSVTSRDDIPCPSHGPMPTNCFLKRVICTPAFPGAPAAGRCIPTRQRLTCGSPPCTHTKSHTQSHTSTHTHTFSPSFSLSFSVRHDMLALGSSLRADRLFCLSYQNSRFPSFCILCQLVDTSTGKFAMVPPGFPAPWPSYHVTRPRLACLCSCGKAISSS